MELRHLRYYVAVAEELNVRQAATGLHLSEPPLSRQIHDLEDEVGTKLFSLPSALIHVPFPFGKSL
jgi:DNA-binding transcriptional LysR family regulator